MKPRRLSRARQLLDAERAENRARLGMAGPFDGLTSGLVGGLVGGTDVAPSVTFEAAFPKIETTISTKDLEGGGTKTETSTVGSGIANWLVKHVVRPKGTVRFAGTSVVWAPGEGEADWSGVARLLGWGIVGGSILGAGWLLWRAFLSYRKNPPRCSRCGRGRRR